MKKQIKVYDWNDEMKEWEKTVKIIRWEHDYTENYYLVDYEEITEKTPELFWPKEK